MPTCGPTSCQMVMSTLGKEVDVAKLMIDSKVGAGGAFMTDLSTAMKNQGVNSSYATAQTLDDLAKATANGKPAIVATKLDRANGGGHAVVVDGITVRQGKAVVAIRDPAGGRQYFTPVSEFMNKFTGEVIYTK